MKITAARVILCSPGRNFATLKVETDAGIHGLGDATLNGREQAVVAYLESHCLAALIGRDPARIEDIWHYFYRGAYWRRGPVTMAAISAIDLALWDIKGKALGTPVHNLLGGTSRSFMRAYAHASGPTLKSALQDLGRKIEAGFSAVRLQAGVPGVGKVYGVSPGEAPYEPARQGVPEEEPWDTERYLRFVPQLFQKARAEHGDEVALLHDVHHRLSPIEAARLARDLEPFRLFWLEDPVAGELPEGLRLVRRHSTTPIAIGEVYNSAYDYTTLITEQLIDYLRMPPSHGGGLTHLWKLVGLAGLYHVKTGFHGATDLSPVGLAASLHLGLAVNNFGIQEWMPHAPVVGEVFRSAYRCEGGRLFVGDAPGLGVDIDEAAAARYPYQMASLPVSRTADGTLFHW